MSNYELRHYGDLFPYEQLEDLIKEHGTIISPQEKQQRDRENGANFYDQCNRSYNGGCNGSMAICDVCNDTCYELLAIEALEELQGMNICSPECMRRELEERTRNNGLQALRQCQGGM